MFLCVANACMHEFMSNTTYTRARMRVVESNMHPSFRAAMPTLRSSVPSTAVAPGEDQGCLPLLLVAGGAVTAYSQSEEVRQSIDPVLRKAHAAGKIVVDEAQAAGKAVVVEAEAVAHKLKASLMPPPPPPARKGWF